MIKKESINALTSAGRPVLACNSGGPKESVLHGSTGFLAEPEAGSFSRAMAQLVVSPFLHPPSCCTRQRLCLESRV